MLTLLIFAVIAYGTWRGIKNRQPSPVQPPNPPAGGAGTAAASQPAGGTATSTLSWGTVKKGANEMVVKHWSKIFKLLVPFTMILILNLGLYSFKGFFFGDIGRKYFTDEYMGSSTFWLIVVAVTAAYFSDPKKSSKVMSSFVKVASALVAICLGYAMFAVPKEFTTAIENGSVVIKIDGKDFPVKMNDTTIAKSQSSESDETLPIVEGAKYTYDIASKIDPETSVAIEKHFGTLGDSTVHLMKRIAFAESDGMQLNADGSVVHNKKDGKATGLFQIMPEHFERCQKSSFDVKTLDGNAGCARLVYNDAHTSTNPWLESAWKWRDNYIDKPMKWQFDQSPTQLIAISHGEDIFTLITAPAIADSSKTQAEAWSPKVSVIIGRDSLYYLWSDGKNVIPYEVRDDKSITKRMSDGDHIGWPRYPKYFEFRSLGTKPIDIIFRRCKKQCSVSM